MKEFFAYFFGKGEIGEYKDFTFAHFAPILIAAGIIYLIYRYRDKIRSSKYDTTIRYVMAFTMIVSEMSYFWRLVGNDLNAIFLYVSPLVGYSTAVLILSPAFALTWSIFRVPAVPGSTNVPSGIIAFQRVLLADISQSIFIELP